MDFFKHTRKGGQVNQLLLKIYPDVAERLGVGRAKAYQLIASGEIKAVKLSKKSFRVTPEALQEFVAKLETEAESEDAA